MRTKIMKWGNSLAIRLPRNIARRASINEGDIVELTLAEEGRTGFTPESKALTLAALVARITPENRHPEIALGPLRGKESPTW